MATKKQRPKATPEQVRYIREYDKEHRIRIGITIHKEYDAEVLEFWQSLPNKAAWLKAKIREEIERQKRAGIR